MGKDTKGGWRHQNKGQGTGDSSDILKRAEGGKMGVRKASGCHVKEERG